MELTVKKRITCLFLCLLGIVAQNVLANTNYAGLNISCTQPL